MEIRQASLEEIDVIKQVADAHTKELGFILRPRLELAVERGELLCEVCTGAFCLYHRRRDGITVIYDICVPADNRDCGIGRGFVECLEPPIQAKCPADLPANVFYRRLGFDLLGQEHSRTGRILNVWEKGKIGWGFFWT